MKTIQVYDPPMCCSSGACGPSIGEPIKCIILGGYGVMKAGSSSESTNGAWAEARPAVADLPAITP